MATTYLKYIKSSLSNVPPVTKSLVAFTLLLSTSARIYIYRQQVNADPDDTNVVAAVCPMVGIVPGMAVYTPWTLLTAAFYESNIISLLFSLFVLLMCGKYLERVWGNRELLKYIVITAVISNLVTWLSILLTFVIARDESYLYTMQISGMSGVFSAFLVAFKHLIPEHRIVLFAKVAIRVKNLIGVATAISILSLILFQAVVFYNLVNIGWVVGWAYIRFFQFQGSVRGDRSEAFALVTFFPDFLRPVIGPLSNVVFNLFVMLRVFKPLSDKDISLYKLEEGLPGGARAEAERRRALALKALDSRLNENSSPKSSSSKNPLPNVLFDAEESQAAAVPVKAPSPAPIDTGDISEAAKRD